MQRQYFDGGSDSDLSFDVSNSCEVSSSENDDSGEESLGAVDDRTTRWEGSWRWRRY